MTTSTVAEILRTARIAPVDARVLLQLVLDVGPAYLAAHPEHVVLGEQLALFQALTARRAAGEPVAYLTGEREFFSLDFKVTPAVLIPRPETELLVELALERIPRDAPCRVLDLGCGSGCIAISIARHRPRAQVTASDRSRDALDIAAENARALGVHDIEFAQGDWFAAIGDGRFDVIVSNPPYIAAGDPHLASGDVRYEPVAALTAGADGLACIRHIVGAAGVNLEEGGWLLLEHGWDQSQACRSLLQAAGFSSVRSWQDLAGIERVSGGAAGQA